MKRQEVCSTFAIGLIAVGSASAAVRCVKVNSTRPASPYLTWAGAATNIQEAVHAADAGDKIVVTSGTDAADGRAVYGLTESYDKAQNVQKVGHVTKLDNFTGAKP